jgi:hypothetical protein
MIRGFRRSHARADQAPAAPGDPNDAFEAAVAVEQRGDLAAAEEGYRAADRLGHPGAAVKLGGLLEERDDLGGAEEAFRRADDRGDATGAFHLGWLLHERGDLAGAEAAYRRAVLRGHPAAEANLRVLAGRARRRPAPTTPPTAAPPTAAPPTQAEPETAIHSAPAPAAGPAAAVASAFTAQGPGLRPRRGGFLQRAASIVLPVAAFAAAFLVGMATRPPARSHPRLAPAVNASESTVTLSSVASVPPSAKLVVKPPPRKPANPAIGSAPIGGISFRRMVPAVPVYSAAAPSSAPAGPPTLQASGTSTTPASTTTSVTGPGTKTSGDTPTGGRSVAGTSGGGTSVNSASSSTTATTPATPSG